MPRVYTHTSSEECLTILNVDGLEIDLFIHLDYLDTVLFSPRLDNK